ncbi:MAG TPA: hypothetical protein VJY42_02235 [Candidatus Methanomethylophilaceae archaeon]|nr:hypothetical protein [Candidatus Methanomethylophilaceae archaeon]
MKTSNRKQSMSERIKANKVERGNIRNQRNQAKVERMRAKTRIREKSGGSMIQIKLTKVLGSKLGREKRESRPTRAQRKLAKAQSRRARKQSRDDKGRFVTEKQGFLKKIRGSDPAPVGAKIEEIKTETVTVKGEKYRIPIDEDGYVPRYALSARFTNVMEGTGPKVEMRNILIDQNSEANTVLKGKLTPEDVKEWWARPNTLDVKGIDDLGSDLVDLATLQTEGRKNAQGKVAVMGGTKEDRETIRKVLTESFTIREQKEMFKNGMTVEIAKLRSGVAGEYHGRKDGMSHLIRIDPRSIDDGDTLLHEAVHHARLMDSKRKGALTKSRSLHPERIAMDKKDVALEEAATVSETLARQRNYQQPNNAGYYDLVPKKGKDVRTMISEDRKLYAGSAETGSTGLKGQRAIKSIEKNFEESNIADLNLKGLGYPSVSARGRLKNIKEEKNK